MPPPGGIGMLELPVLGNGVLDTLLAVLARLGAPPALANNAGDDNCAQLRLGGAALPNVHGMPDAPGVCAVEICLETIFGVITEFGIFIVTEAGSGFIVAIDGTDDNVPVDGTEDGAAVVGKVKFDEERSLTIPGAVRAEEGSAGLDV